MIEESNQKRFEQWIAELGFYPREKTKYDSGKQSVNMTAKKEINKKSC